MKILFISPYPAEGASHRFRVEQYLPYLKENGTSFSVRPFYHSSFYNILYKKGHYIKKFYYFLKSTLKRIRDIYDVKNYDIVFIHREAFPFGTSSIEYLLKIRGKRIIYDFDDSLFLPSISGLYRIISFLKNPKKIKKIIKLSDHIISGNYFLRDFALNYNKSVTVLPTCIDTDKYKPLRKPLNNKKIIIGWMGSHTTVDYLQLLDDIFSFLLNKYKNLEIRIVGGNYKTLSNSRIICKEWFLDSEVKELQEFDIGIMPLKNDDWAKGKCAFKIIQYMAIGIPTVASAVGMNPEVIQDGVNGFLANSESEWIEKTSLLIENSLLRKKLGEAGRKTVEEKFSLKVNSPLFLSILQTHL